ncbi:MAG: DUF1549 domain-containing protein [Isosphaeraceae bacterium]
MGTRDLLFVGLIVGGTMALGASLYPPRLARQPVNVQGRGATQDPGVTQAARAVDAAFHRLWEAEEVRPVKPASELAVIRRLSLALTGSIPSLEELRGLEAVQPGQKIAYWTTTLLRDRRTADYLAERLARAYIGTEGGPFIVFRRRRFVTWLSDQLHENRPYDQIVRELIQGDGIWTDRPATNFITVTYDPELKVVEPERLAGRVSRAFLGARIDCAQCHDHPFAPWKQRDFQGLAAFFGKTESGLTGIHEGESEYKPTDRKTLEAKVVEPRAPFLPELLPSQGNRRQRLAAWVTNPRNNALPRATVNRMWALLLGKALVEPVDNVVHAEEVPEALGILADDFAAHGFDLQRLIRVIAATEVFRLESAGDPEPSEAQERAWAVFPMTPLRPEQIVGAITQSASLTTIDGQSPILVRLIRFFGEIDFVKRFGDSGEEELDPHAVTIPQRLLLMNGELIREQTKPDLFHAASRIASFARDDRSAVEVAYMTVLTRSPTPEELDHFARGLEGTTGDARGERVSDMVWTLLNATESSWNH